MLARASARPKAAFAALTFSLPLSRAREGGPSASGFDPGGAGRELWREPIETAGRVTVSSERARAELFRGRPADGESPACARSEFRARLYPLAAVR
jgi:hypothetical protein